MSILGEEATSLGRSFHTVAPATGNARSPMVDSRVRGTKRRCVDAERKPGRPERADDGTKLPR